MLSKRKEGQHSIEEDEACYPCNEDEKLQDAGRLRCYPTLSTNGLLDESVREARRVHWQSDSAERSKQMSPLSTDVKQRSIGIERDHIRENSDGIGTGGGVRLVSGHRIISVRPLAATSDDDDGEDEDEMERQNGFVNASAITPSSRNDPRMNPKNMKEFSQVVYPPSDIHSELPLIDLESEACTASSVRDRRFESENSVENIKASHLRSDPVKPRSFLEDLNSRIDVTAPVTAFDNSDNSSDLESDFIPLVTVSYLRHDSLAAAGDAAQASTLTEIPNGPNRRENARDDVVEKSDDDAAGFLPMASDASKVASAAAAAAAAAAADLEGAEPFRPASSSSSRSLDRSSSAANDFLHDLNQLSDSVYPDDSVPFARVGPDEDCFDERGECHDEDVTGPGFLLPGSNLTYANEMILTTRPSKVNLLYSPAPPRTRILFQIMRDKIGFYRKYYAHLELNGEKIFYLAGRKRVKSRSSSYVISIDRERMLRDCDAYVGKLRSNYMGTKFTLFNTAEELPCPEDKRSRAHSKGLHKEELAAIIYAPNPLGFYGPRRMTVILPSVTENDERISVISQNAEEDSLLSRYKSGRLKDLIVFHNKAPVWERAKNSYVLNFHGRVTQPSVKNFQLVPPENHNDIMMQFGRIGDNAFTMDFKRPLSAVQAFGIVLSCFDCKLACE